MRRYFSNFAKLNFALFNYYLCERIRVGLFPFDLNAAFDIRTGSQLKNLTHFLLLGKLAPGKYDFVCIAEIWELIAYLVSVRNSVQIYSGNVWQQ